MKKYLLLFIPFIAIIAIIIFLLSASSTPEENNFRWLIYLYFIVITLAFHYGYVVTNRSRPQVFVRFYMASTTIRLLLHLGIIVIYSVFHKSLAVPFIITFMAMYFLFTAFELVVVARRQKGNEKR